MVRDVDYSAVISRIDDCFDASPDELEERNEDDGGTVTEWVATRGSYTYAVYYPGDVDHLTARFRYSIAGTVANILNDRDVTNVVQSGDVDVSEFSSEQLPHVAAQILLGNSPQEAVTSFANDLIQLMSHPCLAFEFHSTDDGTLVGFELRQNIYPFSDHFRYKEFDEAVQTVVTVGHAAATYANLCLDIPSALKAHEPTKPEPYYQ